MDRTSGEGETLEQRTRTAHRLYLTALMRLDVLEDDGRPAAGVSKSELANAQVEHTHQFKLLNLLLVQLGYVPKGLATRADLALALDCEAAPSGECRGQAHHERRAALLG